MILSYDAYEETIEQHKEEKGQLDAIRKELDEIRALVKKD